MNVTDEAIVAGMCAENGWILVDFRRTSNYIGLTVRNFWTEQQALVGFGSANAPLTLGDDTLDQLQLMLEEVDAL